MSRIWMMTPGADTAAPRAPSVGWTGTATTPRAICPDLLSIRDIGEADGWRGRVVRGFFVILRKVRS